MATRVPCWISAACVYGPADCNVVELVSAPGVWDSIRPGEDEGGTIAMLRVTSAGRARTVLTLEGGTCTNTLRP